jgi:hypothetical protein
VERRLHERRVFGEWLNEHSSAVVTYPILCRGGRGQWPRAGRARGQGRRRSLVAVPCGSPGTVVRPLWTDP